MKIMRSTYAHTPRSNTLTNAAKKGTTKDGRFIPMPPFDFGDNTVFCAIGWSLNESYMRTMFWFYCSDLIMSDTVDGDQHRIFGIIGDQV